MRWERTIGVLLSLALLVGGGGAFAAFMWLCAHLNGPHAACAIAAAACVWAIAADVWEHYS